MALLEASGGQSADCHSPGVRLVGHLNDSGCAPEPVAPGSSWPRIRRSSRLKA